ncbi:ubiquitin-2 like Rad60 SUMO-like-domain-containing protein [Absidia repens]|uniref:Ubiquitin-2 like Rad60 SUMO-like-domain-containing protein n=1 Tax=Absidia repens TaxID=90262 RepID=A0A1X2IT92_9FUNG|nr:ubiquitin-2 like Rad60 SUMO-like-domain-containing protein [Absidia repens]
MAATEPSSTAEREATIVDSSIPHKSSFDEDTTSLSVDDEIPLDKSRLTMLLVSGKRRVFDFEPSTTVDAVKTYILDNWPQDWADQTSPSIKNIELVYLGKFLDNNSKLKDNGLLGGHATIVHLVIRQYTKKADDDGKSNQVASRCKCCIIL